LTIAFRNLMQAKRRTLLLGIAVAIVAMLFLVLRTVAYSVSERMVESATTLSAGHVNVGGFFKVRRKASNPVLVGRAKIRAAVQAAVPEAQAVIDRHRGWGRLIGPSSSINVGLSGIVPAEEERFFESVRLAPQSEYKEGGSAEPKGDLKGLSEPNTALIFSAQAKKLGVDVGDTLTLVTEASGGQSNTVDLRIAAIVSDIGFMSNWSIFVPRQTVIDLYRLDADTTGVVMVYLKDAAQATAVMERLRKALGDAKTGGAGYEIMDHDPQPFFVKFEKVSGEDWLGQRLDLTIWSDEISFVLWIATALDLVSFFVVGILALIIAGGIMNSMWMSVRERTKEIGTMRAIGAHKGFIVRLFVVESVLLGLLAGSAGVAIGGLGLAVLNALHIPITNDGARLFLMANTLRFNVHPAQIVTTLVLFALITGVAALYPAFKASRLRPVQALMQIK
jgi:putative ABC transport system permease protein